MPPAVAEIAAQNKAVFYGLLFRSVAETLRTIAADPRHLGAKIGFFAVLHTWGQTLVHHPHLHCVIPGGGLANDGSGWVACRPGFFLPVRVLSRYFRWVLLAALQDAFEAGQLHFAGWLQPLSDPRRFAEHLRPARETEWVVYAKRPFAGPEHDQRQLFWPVHCVASPDLLPGEHRCLRILATEGRHDVDDQSGGAAGVGDGGGRAISAEHRSREGVDPG